MIADGSPKLAHVLFCLNLARCGTFSRVRRSPTDPDRSARSANFPRSLTSTTSLRLVPLPSTCTMSLRKPAVVPASRITRPGTPAQVQLPAPLAALTRPVSGEHRVLLSGASQDRVLSLYHILQAAPSLDTPGPRSPGELGKELTPRPASTPYSLTPFKSPSDSGYETKLIGPHADYFGAKPLL